MCGIYGCIGKFKVNDALRSLKKLEYRGYDSYGILYDDIVFKDIGRIKLMDDNLFANRAICHTRWATNGKVSLENCHPQVSSNNMVFLVHNGILENEKELKDKYFKNHIFKSQTDTEVIVELLAKLLDTYEPLDAIKELQNEIKGAYAILFMIKGINEIYFLKNKSPLLIAYDDNNNYYLSSDIYAFNSSVKYYKHLANMSFGMVGDNNYISDCSDYLEYSFDNKDVSYSDRMYLEIMEEEKCAKLLKDNFFKINPLIIDKIKNATGIVLVGCGSSYYAGMYIRLMYMTMFNKRAYVYEASEFISYNLKEDGLVYIFISQSGETADIKEAYSLVCKDDCILFTNEINSSLANEINLTINIYALKEIAVASTKSFNQTILLAYLLFSKINGNDIDEYYQYIESLKYCKNIFDYNIVKRLKESSKVFYLGSKYTYIVSLEAALKLKEIAYIPTEGYSYRELKHGSLALVDFKTTVIGLISDNSFMSQLNEVEARDGVCFSINLGYKLNYLSGLIYARYVQLLAYYTAKEKGIDPDHPRNLAKSVTVI